jgi:hypothetical protein
MPVFGLAFTSAGYRNLEGSIEQPYTTSTEKYAGKETPQAFGWRKRGRFAIDEAGKGFRQGDCREKGRRSEGRKSLGQSAAVGGEAS